MAALDAWGAAPSGLLPGRGTRQQMSAWHGPRDPTWQTALDAVSAISTSWGESIVAL